MLCQRRDSVFCRNATYRCSCSDLDFYTLGLLKSNCIWIKRQNLHECLNQPGVNKKLSTEPAVEARKTLTLFNNKLYKLFLVDVFGCCFGQDFQNSRKSQWPWGSRLKNNLIIWYSLWMESGQNAKHVRVDGWRNSEILWTIKSARGEF